jgi:hypothetical protein
MHSKKIRVLALAATALTVVASSPAWAADDDKPKPAVVLADDPVADEDAQHATGSEILVTARRREEKLQDVPVAISAISGTDAADTTYRPRRRFRGEAAQFRRGPAEYARIGPVCPRTRRQREQRRRGIRRGPDRRQCVLHPCRLQLARFRRSRPCRAGPWAAGHAARQEHHDRRADRHHQAA